MKSLRLLVAYDGTSFHGFAVQPGLRTVEGVLAETLGAVLGRPVRLVAAGRTDAGVHALGQVVSLGEPVEVEPETLRRRLGALVPPDVAVLDVQPAPPGFDARRWARSRSYVYLLWHHETAHPMYRKYALHVPGRLDVRRLDEALRASVGTFDFTSFARLRPGQSPVRTVLEAWAVEDPPFVRIRVTAESFLHQMVRSLVGTALEVALGRRPPGAVRQALAARDRAAAGAVLPPHGLALVGVRYDDVAWPHAPAAAWPWSDPVDALRSCA